MASKKTKAKSAPKKAAPAIQEQLTAPAKAAEPSASQSRRYAKAEAADAAAAKTGG